LATSKGWVEVNEFVEIVGALADGTPITSNGLPMTEDFDLAVYVKGDAKSTAIFNAQLIIEYEGEEPEPPTGVDLAVSLITVPSKILVGESGTVAVTVANLGADAMIEGATVELTGVGNKGATYTYPVANILADDLNAGPVTLNYTFTEQQDGSAVIVWTATVTTDGDVNPLNDSAEATTTIKKK